MSMATKIGDKPGQAKRWVALAALLVGIWYTGLPQAYWSWTARQDDVITVENFVESSTVDATVDDENKAAPTTRQQKQRRKPMPSGPAVAISYETDVVHRVQKRETVYALAKKYGKTPGKILDVNPKIKKNPNYVQAGTLVRIPAN